MTIREFFKSVRGKGLLVIALNKSRQTLLMDTASAKGIRYDKPKIDNSTKRDLSDVLIEIYAKGESIDKQFLLQLQQLSDMRMIAMNLINIVTDDERKTILQYRYIQCMDWDTIAKAFPYSKRHVIRLHNEALTEMEEKTGEIKDVTQCHSKRC